MSGHNRCRFGGNQKARDEEREHRKRRGKPYAQFVKEWSREKPPSDVPFFGMLGRQGCDLSGQPGQRSRAPNGRRDDARSQGRSHPSTGGRAAKGRREAGRISAGGYSYGWQDRNIWLRVGIGLGRVVDRGADIWLDPGAVRRALLELQGVFPVTHLEVSLSDVALRAPNRRQLVRVSARCRPLERAHRRIEPGDRRRRSRARFVGRRICRTRECGREVDRRRIRTRRAQGGSRDRLVSARLRESSLQFTVVQIADIEAAASRARSRRY